MANTTLQPGYALANTPAHVALIPTPFARLHAEIEACDREDELAEAILAIHPRLWDLPAGAHRALNAAMNRRCADLREVRS